jgi:pimeloyl-ACP methyl ester carboxylesterase
MSAEPAWSRAVVARPDGDVVAWRLGTGTRPVVSFHALMPAASGRIGAELSQELARRCGVSVYGVDAPGFGQSPAPPSPADYAMDALARRLAGAVADLAAGPARAERAQRGPVLMGHSWGAALACRVAIGLDPRPVGLVLVDGGHFDHADLPEADPSETVDDVHHQMVAAGWAVAEATLAACVERVAGPGVDGRPALPAAVRAGLTETATGLRSRVDLADAAAAMHGLMNSRTSDTYPDLVAAGIPVLLLVATRPEQRASQNRERVATLRRRLTDLEVVEVDSGHDIPIDAPAPAAEAMARWLVARGLAEPV